MVLLKSVKKHNKRDWTGLNCEWQAANGKWKGNGILQYGPLSSAYLQWTSTGEEHLKVAYTVEKIITIWTTFTYIFSMVQCCRRTSESSLYVILYIWIHFASRNWKILALSAWIDHPFSPVLMGQFAQYFGVLLISRSSPEFRELFYPF